MINFISDKGVFSAYFNLIVLFFDLTDSDVFDYFSFKTSLANLLHRSSTKGCIRTGCYYFTFGHPDHHLATFFRFLVHISCTFILSQLVDVALGHSASAAFLTSYLPNFEPGFLLPV